MRSSLFWYVTQHSGRKLPTFRDKLPVPSSRIKLDPSRWGDTLSRNVGNYESALRNFQGEQQKPEITQMSKFARILTIRVTCKKNLSWCSN